MKLTRERAVQLHRRLWRWIALKTLKEKRKVEKYEFPMFRRMDIRCNCFCCEYVYQNFGSCARTDKPPHCPIEWGDEVFCADCSTPYSKWDIEENDYRRCAKLASAIAKLPERKENEE
jgi:hypothetical protein